MDCYGDKRDFFAITSSEHLQEVVCCCVDSY